MTSEAIELSNFFRKKELALFCGSGISFNSNIPTVEPLVRYILSKLQIEPSHIDTYIKRGYPFEGFTEILEFYLKNTTDMLEVFNVARPNENHLFIAHCLKNGLCNLVYTTNFDINIELACLSLGMKKGLDFNVYSTPEELLNIEFNTIIPKLVKLHGSIESKEHLGVTIQKIATQQFQRVLQPSLTHLVSSGQHSTVLFLGYSFSDRFDILPALSSVSVISKKVRILQHDDQAEEILFGSNVKALHDVKNIKTISYNTDKIVDLLGTMLFNGEFNTKNHIIRNNREWEAKIDSWINASLTGERLQNGTSIALKMFTSIHERKICAHYLQMGWDQVRRNPQDLKFACDINARSAQNIDLEHANFNELNFCMHRYKRAVIYAKWENSMDDVMTHLGNVGGVYMYLALHYYSINDKRPGDVYKAKSLQYTNDCISYFDKNKNRIKTGHEKYIGLLMNSGITYRKLGELTRARNSYEKVLSECSAISSGGILGIKCQCLFCLGTVFELQHDVLNALKYYHESCELAVAMSLRERLYYSVRSIVKLYQVIGDIATAQSFFNSQLEPLRKLNIQPEDFVTGLKFNDASSSGT